MLIENLSHFESALDNSLIAGAAGTGVAVSAIALGSSTSTWATANSIARSLPNNGSLSISRGFGFARGEGPLAQVIASGDGDIVVGSTHSTPDIQAKPVDVAHGVVVAIDLPN